MRDDLVQELRDWAAIVEEAAAQNVHVQVLNMNMCKEAADEIERLRNQTEGIVDEFRKLHKAWLETVNEVEQLRILGDALADGARSGRSDDAIDAWQEARRD